jgi:hypothetical protein
MSLADSTDRWITRHLADTASFQRDQNHISANPRGSRCSFNSSVTSSYNNNFRQLNHGIIVSFGTTKKRGK